MWHNLPSGGGKRALYDHVSGLLHRGHEIESWCPPTADQGFLPLGRLVPEHVVPLRYREAAPGRRVLSRVTGGATRTWAWLRHLEEHARLCAREIEQSGYDVVLVAGSRYIAVPPIGRYLAGPAVLYLQEPTRRLYEALPRLPWAALSGGTHAAPVQAALRVRDALAVRAMRVQVREEATSARSFARLLTNSHFSRESILRAYGVDAHVCSLGVDTDRLVDRGRPRERLVVGIGAFVPHKRIDVAIEAVAALAPPRPTLKWIGDRVDTSHLHQLQALASTVDVNFEPLVSIPDEEVLDILSSAAVMVYAPRLEPFGYGPLEAAACGLPVVAVAEGGVRESVLDRQTGILVDHDHQLAGALGELLSDEPLRRQMGEAARRGAEMTWSLDAAVSRLESHLVDVLSDRVIQHGPARKR